MVHQDGTKLESLGKYLYGSALGVLTAVCVNVGRNPDNFPSAQGVDGEFHSSGLRHVGDASESAVP